MSNSFPLQPGTVLRDRYIVQEVVHSDHWSLTVRARHRSNGQMVSLKLPGPGSCASGVNIAFHAAWMQRVFHCLSQLHHPNRASVLDYVEAHGMPILVQQEVLGIPMSQRLMHQPLPEQEAIAIVRKIALALSGVHGKGLIHRDVRPENIIYRSGVKQPVLIDWGLQPSVFPANRASSYAAPEQFQPGGQFQPSIDVYGLAATLYALVTGQPPLHASLRQQSPLELPRSLRPGLSTAVERAILCGMELNPQARPPSMGAWMGLLPESSPVSPEPEVAQPNSEVSHTAPEVTVPVGQASSHSGRTDKAARTAQSEKAQPVPPKPRNPQPTAATVAVAAAPASTQTIDLEPTPTASPPSNPMKTLLLLSCAATLFGASMGLILRITNPVSVAGISALGRPQSFPEEEWPGSKNFRERSLDLPPPEQGFNSWEGDNGWEREDSWDQGEEEVPAEEFDEWAEEWAEESPREWVAPVDDEPPMPQSIAQPEFGQDEATQPGTSSESWGRERWAEPESVESDSRSQDYYESPNYRSSGEADPYADEPAPTPVETLEEPSELSPQDYGEKPYRDEPLSGPGDVTPTPDADYPAEAPYEALPYYDEPSSADPIYEESYPEEPRYYESPSEASPSFEESPYFEPQEDASAVPWEESFAPEPGVDGR